MTVTTFTPIILILSQASADLVSQQEQTAPAGLTPAGATMMIASITMVIALCVFCTYRILREPHPETHHHAPLEIDTNDQL